MRVFNALYQKHTFTRKMLLASVCMYCFALLATLPVFAKCQISRISFHIFLFFVKKRKKQEKKVVTHAEVLQGVLSSVTIKF